MENLEKDFIRDIVILDKLKSEQQENYNQILSQIRKRRNIRIFWRAALSCAAAALLVLAFEFSFRGSEKAPAVIADKLDVEQTPVLITETGERIALKNDNSYTLEYSDENSAVSNNGVQADLNVREKAVPAQPVLEAEDKSASKQTGSVSRNTVIIPNGYTYNIKFDDGTMAHINSGSYIEYPKSFSNRERRVVSLTGEGYFKVAKSEKPFIVKVGGLEVKVYGTEFNLNTNKENRVEVILVNGSVGVKKEGAEDEIMLNPNQMLVYNVKTDEAHSQIVEPSDHLGWMKGDFACSNQSMFDLMDEICAFYGITINKDPKLSDKMITISLSRKLGFMQIMEIMEPAFGLEFTQNGKMEFTCRESNN